MLTIKLTAKRLTDRRTVVEWRRSIERWRKAATMVQAVHFGCVFQLLKSTVSCHGISYYIVWYVLRMILSATILFLFVKITSPMAHKLVCLAVHSWHQKPTSQMCNRLDHSVIIFFFSFEKINLNIYSSWATFLCPLWINKYSIRTCLLKYWLTATKFAVN